MYNFNKDSKDNDSMIGITLYNTGEISTAHYKNDDHYKRMREIRDTLTRGLDERLGR